MGYYSCVTGEITINPPIPARHLAKSPIMAGLENGLAITFRVDETATEVDEGTLIRSEVTAIVPAMEGEQYKAYDIDKHMVVAAQLVREHGSTCKGELVRVGEDPGDVERYVVNPDSAAVSTEKARLTWPDGTEVTL